MSGGGRTQALLNTVVQFASPKNVGIVTFLTKTLCKVYQYDKSIQVGTLWPTFFTVLINNSSFFLLARHDIIIVQNKSLKMIYNYSVYTKKKIDNHSRSLRKGRSGA